MRRLACLFVLFAACVPDEAELSYPIRPIGGPSGIGGSTTAPDAGGGTGGDTGVVDAGVGPDVDLRDGGTSIGADAGDFPQDAGGFLDAFMVPADGPGFPGGDQIP